METNYIISSEKSKRINILKMLLAVFVVYVHSEMSEIGLNGSMQSFDNPMWFETLTYTISTVICRCCNPGFFVLASIFLYRKAFTWKSNMAKKVKTLLVPYLIANTLLIAVYAVFQAVPFTKQFFGNQEHMVASFTIIEWLKAYGIGTEFPMLLPTWFMRNLLVLNLLAIVIRKLIDRFPVAYFIVITANYLFSPFSLGHLLNPRDLFFWSMGYYIVKYQKDINYFDDKKYVPICYIVLAAIRAAIFGVNADIPVPLNNLLEMLTFSAGLIFWYSCFTKNVEGKAQKLLDKYSSYNFTIYIFHGFILGFGQKLCLKVLPQTTFVFLLTYLILPIAVIVIVIFAGSIMKKVIPKTYAVITGGRTV